MLPRPIPSPRTLASLTIALLPSIATAQVRVRWTDRASDPLLPNAFRTATAGVLDGTGGVLIATFASEYPQVSSRLRKLDPSGALAWDVAASPAGVRLNSEAHPDGSGGAYFTGQADLGGPSFQAVVATRVDASGVQLWTHVWSPFWLSGTDWMHSTLDVAGNLWLAGSSQIHERVYVRALSPAGTLLFHNELPGQEYTFVSDVRALPAGGVALCGDRNFEPLVRTFGATGAAGWSATVVPPSYDFTSRFGRLAVDSSTGRIAACGVLEIGSASQQGLLAVRDANGALLWSEQLGGEFAQPTWLNDLAFASDGALWVVGAIGAGASSRALTLRYDASGSRTLTRVAGSPLAPAQFGAQLIPGRAGQVWVATAGIDPLPPHALDVSLIELDAAGQQHWRAPLGRPGLSEPLSVLRSAAGFVVLGGVATPLSSGGESLVISLGAPGLPDGYCSAQVNSQGCTPLLVYTGIASASESAGFVVTVERVVNRSAGLFVYGSSGPANAPLLGGVRCVAGPLRRTPLLATGGQPAPALDCSGRLALDFNAFSAGALGGSPDAALAQPGTPIFVQAWTRDAASPSGANLSSALRYVVQP